MPAWDVSRNTETFPYPSGTAISLVEGLTQVPRCRDAGSSLHFSREQAFRDAMHRAMTHHQTLGLALAPSCSVVTFKDPKP